MSGKICAVDDASRAALSNKATVTCARCGAKGHEPANVCAPVQIPDAGFLGD